MWKPASVMNCHTKPSFPMSPMKLSHNKERPSKVFRHDITSTIYVQGVDCGRTSTPRGMHCYMTIWGGECTLATELPLQLLAAHARPFPVEGGGEVVRQQLVGEHRFHPAGELCRVLHLCNHPATHPI
eukprot:7236532-Pyramimonas_sp.AAC.1